MKEEQAAERRAAGLDEGDGGDIFEEEHDEDLLFQRKAWKLKKMILCDLCHSDLGSDLQGVFWVT